MKAEAAAEFGTSVDYSAEALPKVSDVFSRADINMPITLPLVPPGVPEFKLEPGKAFLLQLPSHLTIGNVPERQLPVGSQRGARAADAADDNDDDDEVVGSGARGKQKLSSRDVAATLSAGSLSLDAPLQALSVAKLASDGLSLRDSQADALLQAASNEIDEDQDDVLPGNRFNNKFIEQGIAGEIGELRRYANGRMVLVINGQELLVQRGVYPTHHIEAVAVVPGPPDSNTDKLYSGLQITDSLIATASTTHLLDAMLKARAKS